MDKREVALRTFCAQPVCESREKPVAIRTQAVHRSIVKWTLPTTFRVQPTRNPRFIPHGSTTLSTRKNQHSNLLNSHLPTLSTPPTITTTIFI